VTPQDKMIREIRDDIIADALTGQDGPVARSLAVYCQELMDERDQLMLRIMGMEDRIASEVEAGSAMSTQVCPHLQHDEWGHETCEARAKLEKIKATIALFCTTCKQCPVGEIAK